MLHKGKKHQLFCPGPVNTHVSVKQAVVTNEIGHREPEFSKLLVSIQEKLLALYGVSEQSGYHAVVVTGSGTAANEAVLSSAVGDQHILIISNGEFGQRLYETSKFYNPNTHHLSFEWGESIDLALLEDYLAKNPVDIVAMVHHETSTGMLNPIREIGELLHRNHKQFIIDTVSSAGAELINLAECHVTFCTGSASKALCSMPGVSYVVGKDLAFDALAGIPAKTLYLNLFRFYHYSKTVHQTPNTPAVQSFFALEQALANILAEGLEQNHAKLQARAAYMRAGLKRLGLTFLIPEDQMSCVLTTVVLPSQIKAEYIREGLRSDGTIVYAGKGPVTGKVFQVATIGEMKKKDIDNFLSSLSQLLVPSVQTARRSIRPARVKR